MSPGQYEKGCDIFFGDRLSVKKLRDHSNSFVHDGRCGQTSTLKGEPKRRQRSPRLARKLCDELVRTFPKNIRPRRRICAGMEKVSEYAIGFAQARNSIPSRCVF